jgi:hypothetical protein
MRSKLHRSNIRGIEFFKKCSHYFHELTIAPLSCSANFGAPSINKIVIDNFYVTYRNNKLDRKKQLNFILEFSK